MKGCILKEKLELAGYREFDKDLALQIGVRERELERILISNDVKSSDLEKIQKRLSLPPGYFFEDNLKGKKLLGDLKIEPEPTILKESQHQLGINLQEDEKLIYVIIISISCREDKTRAIDVFTLDKYNKFQWHNKGEGGTIFFLFKNDNSCVTRFFDENLKSHDFYIGEFGLRIMLDSKTNNGEYNLSLYSDKEKLFEEIVNIYNFEEGFNKVWAKYEDVENDKHIQNCL